LAYLDIHCAASLIADIQCPLLPNLLPNAMGPGDAYADHIDHAVWLGSVLPLRMNVLRKSRKTPSHS
jgi:hypothetical protein